MNETRKTRGAISVFERYLTVWVLLCMGIGVMIGQFLPIIPETLSRYEYYQVSVPTAILIWIMIFPMMLKVDFTSVVGVTKKPVGLFLTTFVNWAIKPFTMFAIASLFFLYIFDGLIANELAREYVAGAVILGAAPCTAMVFVWSKLTNGDPAYTLVQVSVNDLLVIVLFAPIVALLLGVGNVIVPWNTLILSTVLFIVVPLLMAIITRRVIVNKKGQHYFEHNFISKFDRVTITGLMLTLIIIFSFQGERIVQNPLHILLIAIPLTIQTFLIFAITYSGAYACKLPFNIAAPSAMIGASNFFELAVAVSISLFGLNSGATLATVVGVLVEVPVMLLLVRIANGTKGKFDRFANN
ncbi:ACR3 family arsenite efflux transporter [Alkalibacterium sp. 20]|uniref:ACR3 family arsenite efflux transporter n=1 Tax=Alkalibacterium sp. 20 TaxID=1798803 RepID=UPI000900088F|nr:ACR3 family arsenite efflux transporter [Alkalibacterium sp. 20]OJF92708.1 arsenic transporter [Alkalibacterium sp. 20]